MIKLSLQLYHEYNYTVCASVITSFTPIHINLYLIITQLYKTQVCIRTGHCLME